MNTATITFKTDSYSTDTALVESFRELVIPTTYNCFYKAEIVQEFHNALNPNFSSLTLYSKNGFIIKFKGLICGKNGNFILSLLKYCNFEVDDATAFAILQYKTIHINLWILENRP